VSLPGDDQEERKNDTQLKTTLMFMEMIDRWMDGWKERRREKEIFYSFILFD